MPRRDTTGKALRKLVLLPARGSIVAPLAALLATAVVAIAMAATSGLALCRHQVALSMPMAMPVDMPMPDMPAAAPGIVDLCPVVMGLLVLALSLAAWAVVALALDRHRAVVRHRFFALLAGLPIVRSVAALAAVSTLPIGLIIAVDAGGPASTEGWLLLTAFVAGGAVLATLAAVFGARCVLGLGRRLILRIAAARVPARRRLRPAAIHDREPVSSASAHGDVCVLAAGRGLRAPPLLAR